MSNHILPRQRLAEELNLTKVPSEIPVKVTAAFMAASALIGGALANEASASTLPTPSFTYNPSTKELIRDPVTQKNSDIDKYPLEKPSAFYDQDSLDQPTANTVVPASQKNISSQPGQPGELKIVEGSNIIEALINAGITPSNKNILSFMATNGITNTHDVLPGIYEEPQVILDQPTANTVVPASQKNISSQPGQPGELKIVEGSNIIQAMQKAGIAPTAENIAAFMVENQITNTHDVLPGIYKVPQYILKQLTTNSVVPASQAQQKPEFKFYKQPKPPTQAPAPAEVSPKPQPAPTQAPAPAPAEVSPKLQPTPTQAPAPAPAPNLNLTPEAIANPNPNLNPIPPQYLQFYIESAQNASAINPLITPALLAAQCNQESGFNPTVGSYAGAVGISQFLPSTFYSVYNKPGASPFNPQDAIMAQGIYMANLANEITQNLHLSDPALIIQYTLAAYNAGLGAVLSANGIPEITQTQNYVANISSTISDYQQEINQMLSSITPTPTPTPTAPTPTAPTPTAPTPTAPTPTAPKVAPDVINIK